MTSGQPRAPNLRELNDLLERACLSETYACSSVSSVPSASKQEKGPSKAVTFNRTKAVLNTTVIDTPQDTPSTCDSSCVMCNGQHNIETCNEYKALSPVEKTDTVRNKGLCYRCLMKGHLEADCSKTTICGVNDCKANHHPTLHDCPRLAPQPTTRIPENDHGPLRDNNCLHATQSGSRVLLAVVPVLIETQSHCVESWALLDRGSQVSLIDQTLAKEIGLNGKPTPQRFRTFEGFVVVPSYSVNLSE